MSLPQRLAADLLDLVLPRSCAGCGAAGRTLCQGCRALLGGEPFLHVPGAAPDGLPAVVAAAVYAGPVRQVLLAHKERGRTPLVRPLSEALAVAVADFGRDVLLVPVPSARAAVRARGHDHARRLARATARRSGVGWAPVLRQARVVADQAGLSAAARGANLAGALECRADLTGVAVVVLDDIVTTGSTLAEAARVLTEAGADVLGAAVVAATPLHAGG